jgi:hypothetical protein
VDVINSPIGLDLTLLCSLSEDPDRDTKSFYVKLSRLIAKGNVETCLEIDYVNNIRTIYNKDLNVALLVVERGLNDSVLKSKVLEIISKYMNTSVSKEMEIAGKTIFTWGDVKTAMEQYNQLK